MNDHAGTLGLIAGNRSLPLTFAQLARAAGVQKLVAVAFEGETDPALASLVDEIVWLKVGQLSKLIIAFRARAVCRCVMAGQIAPKNLFELRPDLRAVGLLLRLKQRNARTLFGAVADELLKEGVTLIDARPWLEPILPGKGYHLGPKLTAAQREDIVFGKQIADAIARLDIGQLVVVKNGTVLAVEAFEGTDACLRRGGELAGENGGGVAVKVASPDHDFRFDIPCLGPQTVETCARAKIAVLAFGSGQTLLLEREKTEALAVKNQLTLSTFD
jgi:DUF1009 family protein